jgi:hypothetical protein
MCWGETVLWDMECRPSPGHDGPLERKEVEAKPLAIIRRSGKAGDAVQSCRRRIEMVG